MPVRVQHLWVRPSVRFVYVKLSRTRPVLVVELWIDWNVLMFHLVSSAVVRCLCSWWHLREMPYKHCALAFPREPFQVAKLHFPVDLRSLRQKIGFTKGAFMSTLTSRFHNYTVKILAIRILVYIIRFRPMAKARRHSRLWKHRGGASSTFAMFVNIGSELLRNAVGGRAGHPERLWRPWMRCRAALSSRRDASDIISMHSRGPLFVLMQVPCTASMYTLNRCDSGWFACMCELVLFRLWLRVHNVVVFAAA